VPRLPVRSLGTREIDAVSLDDALPIYVLLDRGLAGQAPALAGLAPVEVSLLGGQHLAAAAQHHTLALGAGTATAAGRGQKNIVRSEEHTSELQSRENHVCRLLLEKKNK